MAIKAFNVNEEIYKEFAKYCKKEGISMSKKVENYIKSELESLKIKVLERKSFDKTSDKPSTPQENSFAKYCH